MSRTSNQKRFVFPITLKLQGKEYAPGQPVPLSAKLADAYVGKFNGEPYVPQEGSFVAAPVKPVGKALEIAIKGTFPELLKDPEALTADDKPSVHAVEKVLGYDIDAGDRDAAWKVFQKDKPSTSDPKTGAPLV